MKEKTTEILSKDKMKYEILNQLELDIKNIENPLSIPLEELFLVGARKNNSKRGFLFVSKVLGKHLRIKPKRALKYPTLLAYLLKCRLENRSIDDEISKDILNEKFNHKFSLAKKVNLIGFAETATGLGHSIMSNFNDKAKYIHTTREELSLDKIFEFQEEHSHATNHNFYSLDSEFLKNEDPIVLIDDEITTGKTCLNLIEKLQAYCPRKEYYILSILDWRNEEHKKRYSEFARENNIAIRTISLISGEVDAKGDNLFVDVSEELGGSQKHCIEDIKVNNIFLGDLFRENTIEIDGKKYLDFTGRFGIDACKQREMETKIDSFADYFRKKITGDRPLFLGTGEFIYIPMFIAENISSEIEFHSTTRSPILPRRDSGYPINNLIEFDNPENKAIKNYLYNLDSKKYDEVFVFFEGNLKCGDLTELSLKFAGKGFKEINYCFMTKERD